MLQEPALSAGDPSPKFTMTLQGSMLKVEADITAVTLCPAIAAVGETDTIVMAEDTEALSRIEKITAMLQVDKRFFFIFPPRL